MDGLATEWAGRVTVVRLNIHDPATRPLAARLGFRLTPTYILFDSAGREVWRAHGVINPAAARQVVNDLQS